MPKGYVIIVKEYKAEIVEFITLSVSEMPDGSKLYYVCTKYGDDYFREQDLSPIRKALEKECEDMNNALRGLDARSNNKIH